MEPTRRFGRYEVIEPLGQGAMGAVYKARDPAIDRLVAVKTLSGPLLAFPEHREEYLARFRQEARAAGRLSHPAIVAVHDVGVEDATATPFLVMEYVPGVSLATVLHENPALPVDQALDIVEQIGSALAEAHAHGIVHRDVKPGNVFLDDRGRVKVGDFGIARMEDSELTQTGVGLGTPGYVAPEVLRGGRADARSDVFSLGVVAYLLLTGKKPFAGKTGQEMGVQILQHEPPPPRSVRDGVPEAASSAVMRALAKDPEARTPNVSRFLAELRATPAASTVTSLAAPAVGGRGRRVAVAALLLGVLAAGGVALALRNRAGDDPKPAPSAPATSLPTAARAPTPTLRPSPRPAPPRTEDDEQGSGDRQKDDHKDQDHGRGKGKGKKKGH